MNENYLKVGDLVRVTQFNGATGQIIQSRYGTNSIFEIVEVDCQRRRSPDKNLASIKPSGSSDVPIAAHWERLEKIVSLMPAPDMDLDEIHRAQALMEG